MQQIGSNFNFQVQRLINSAVVQESPSHPLYGNKMFSVVCLDEIRPVMSVSSIR